MSRRRKTSENNDAQRLLNVADIADLLSISQSLVYQLVESGKIPFLRIGNGRGSIRFQSADVTAYLDSCRVEKVEPKSPSIRLRLKHVRLKND